MNNLDELKALWHSAKTDSLPSSDDMVQIIKKFRNQKLRNKWLVIVGSCLLSGLMITLLCVIPFKFPSTYVGGALMAISGLLLAATNIRSIKRFYLLNNCSNLEFVAFIEQTRQNQIYYYKKTQLVIMLLCSAGLLLYIYEAASKQLWFTGAYAVSIAYLLVIWFWVRPRYFKKNTEKLNLTLQRLQHISKQLNN